MHSGIPSSGLHQLALWYSVRSGAGRLICIHKMPHKQPRSVASLAIISWPLVACAFCIASYAVANSAGIILACFSKSRDFRTDGHVGFDPEALRFSVHDSESFVAPRVVTIPTHDGDGDLYRKEKEHEQRQQFRDVMNQLASIIYRMINPDSARHIGQAIDVICAAGGWSARSLAEILKHDRKRFDRFALEVIGTSTKLRQLGVQLNHHYCHRFNSDQLLSRSVPDIYGVDPHPEEACTLNFKPVVVRPYSQPDLSIYKCVP